jgi:mRNA interferase RelE/StbE
MYEVLISHEAEKYYKKQDKDTKRRLNKCIDNLAEEPIFGIHIKSLHGELEGKYRYEMGDFRIVYEVNIKNRTVEIKSIRSRGDVYKR